MPQFKQAWRQGQSGTERILSPKDPKQRKRMKLGMSAVMGMTGPGRKPLPGDAISRGLMKELPSKGTINQFRELIGKEGVKKLQLKLGKGVKSQ